ncbi:hypothetical protein E3T54_11875 [Cryobacterium sp. Sr8]|uniref:hypothetical protein n=1 Tax=Cryobacterium sp. Sr8 TaxID=1259203 RepID=UPI00106A267A|nr:hypothetical protein [Cryobacterium sp. Sr8]TFD75424.1 hypothetical protein E3T54_11875 [Cryobacterium sp. Sr8]
MTDFGGDRHRGTFDILVEPLAGRAARTVTLTIDGKTTTLTDGGEVRSIRFKRRVVGDFGQYAPIVNGRTLEVLEIGRIANFTRRGDVPL